MSKGIHKEELEELPLYWVYLQMGAWSPDKIGWKGGEKDTQMLEMAKWKKREAKLNG